MISESYKQFRQTDSVVTVIRKYGLPAYHSFDAAKVLAVMGSDKKKVNDVINYVMLERIGKAVVTPVSMDEISGLITQLENKRS